MHWLLPLLFLLSSCVGRNPTQVEPIKPTVAETIVAPVKPIELTEKLKEQAEDFDSFLHEDLSKQEEESLAVACKADPKSDPFCFGYLNYDALEDKFKAYLLPDAHPRKSPRVKPKFSNGEVTNWKALSSTSVSALIKSLSHATTPHLKILSALALKEPACPNPVAVAVAATLEEKLPDGVDMGELAQLYEKGGDCPLTPDDKESVLTRAGLFYYVKHDFTHSIQALQKSANLEMVKSPRALFWLYRAQTESGDKPAAQKTLDKLKERFPFSFHAVMARLSEKQDPDDVLVRSDATPLKKSQKVPSANDMVDAVDILHRSGFEDSASKVLDWTIAEAASAEPEFRLYLAELKAGQEEPQSSLLLLTKVLVENPGLVSKKTLMSYFPKSYYSFFEKHSGGNDPYLMLAIARQESAFNPKAISSAKAKGLLQLKSSRRSRRGNLFDPEVNIKAGAKFFSLLLGMNDGKLHLALASYNAGPKRAEVWLKRYPSQSPILFIDLIPYKETRAYVALILRNYYWYRRIHSPLEAKIPWATQDAKEQAFWLNPPPATSKLF